jgi:hypothetical protein
MQTSTVAVARFAVLVLPARVAAKPSAQDRNVAQKRCKLERGRTRAPREAFKAKYHMHAHGQCVSTKAHGV